MKNSLLKDFIKYVWLNVLGMIGISLYILADTYFVSQVLGGEAIAALNFALPAYSIINGIALMLGIGGGSRFKTLKSLGKTEKSNMVFSQSVKLGLFIGIVFLVIGVPFSKSISIALGAQDNILPMTDVYLKTVFFFTPWFILNHVFIAFVRNDESPRLSMMAMIIGSFSNVILDYIFMYPLGMGMFGAAFATCLAPIISLLILRTHFKGPNNNLKFIKTNFSKDTFNILKAGNSSLILELSSGVVLFIFNAVLLRIGGNLAVAAYGIISNIALVVTSIFTGIAQGIQPLVSYYYGARKKVELFMIKKYSLSLSILVALIIYIIIYTNAQSITSIFNSQKNIEISIIAEKGLKIYFIGFLFAGINIIMSIFLSASESVRLAFIISIFRGFLLIVPVVLIMSNIFLLDGVWLSFPVTELLVLLIHNIIVYFLNTKNKKIE